LFESLFVAVDFLLIALFDFWMSLYIGTLIASAISLFGAMLALAIVILVILFSIWAYLKPKWESHVHIGAGVGSEGRKGVRLENVNTANNVIPSNTLFSNHEERAIKSNSTNTLATLAMITKQPKEVESESIGDVVNVGVEAMGSVMSDGSLGKKSVLRYQWYYNTIDTNKLIEESVTGSEEHYSHKVEGATDRELSVEIDWVGSRYYFVVVTNEVLAFRGPSNSVTTRVGSRDISVRAASIAEQPKSSRIEINRVGELRVEAEATGTISYQWYVSREEDMKDRVLISGGDRAEYSPIHSEAGEYYYQVVVTVMVRATGGEELRKDTESEVARVRV
jgi:hypothetical protein